MLQLLQNLKSGKLALEEVPTPLLDERFVLVQNAHSALSAGTEKFLISMGNKSLVGKAMARPDLVKKVIHKAKTEGLRSTYQTVNARLTTPSPLGNSCAGVVVETGIAANGVRVGQRVACGGAGYASHAEYITAPRNLVVPIPDAVSTEEAAFTTLGAIALQGVRMAAPRMGEKFLVIGLGLLGQISVQLLLANGCSVIGCDISDPLIKRITQLGAQGVSAGEEVIDACSAFSQGRGVDGVLICAATPSDEPVSTAGAVVREKGRVVVVGAVGMNVPREPYYAKEVSLVVSRSYGPGRYDPSFEEAGLDYPYGYVRFTEQRNMETFLELLEKKKVDVKSLITHRFPFSSALDAYGLIDGSRKEAYLGIVLDYGLGESDAKPHQAPIDKAPASLKKGKTGVSVIGAGNYATGVLLPAFSAHGKVSLSSIASSGGRSAKNAAKQFGFCHCSGDIDELMADASTLLVIATRHDSHASLAKKALKAKKNVYVEKPLATTLKDLASLYKAAKKAKGQQLLAGFNRSFSPLVEDVISRFSSTNDPKTIAIRVNAGEIPDSHWVQDARHGGRLIGEACHFVDLATALSGSEISSVFATGLGNGKSPLLNDDFTLSLSFSDGSIATITYTSKGAKGMSKEYIEVFSAGRCAVIDDFSKGTFYVGPNKGKKFGTGKQNKGQKEMVKAMIEGLISGVPAQSSDDLFRTTLATIRAVESIATGQPKQVSLKDLKKS
jgi:predicted dehydrogenase/threonine dehydrogenase-like Zn-dependent dehydrogenase